MTVRTKASSLEESYRQRAVLRDDGHADWRGSFNSGGTPVLSWRGTSYSALRVAYRIAHGREPEGRAFAGCTHDGCVAPQCMRDSAVTPWPGRHRMGKRRPNGTRAEIVALLGQGLSNQRIAQLLRTSPRRVGQIRKELGLPPAAVPPRRPRDPSVEDAFRRHARPVDGEHMEWAGPRRDGLPVVCHSGRTYMARRIAFRIAAGRDAEGPVTVGCDMADCVAPDHMEDKRLRTQYTAIFGDVA